jgi:HEAT repeat protein
MKRAGDVDGLVHALADRRPKVRCRAAEALGQLGAVEAADDLVEVLEDEQDWLARRCLVSALNDLGDERALEPALADLRALEADERLPGGGDEDAYWVGRDAGRVRSPELVERLGELALDDRWIVRLGVAYALAVAQDERSEETLRALIDDPDFNVREAAKEGLEERKSPP